MCSSSAEITENNRLSAQPLHIPEHSPYTHQGCASTGLVFTMSVTVDVAAVEPNDAPSVPDTALAPTTKQDRDPYRVAGHCDFCHAPLPLFTRLRTWRGWGFG
jgi:hypothetical protein